MPDCDSKAVAIGRTGEYFSMKPTIVLVHGALTDASVWSGVSKNLRSKGYTTIAPALALRSLEEDAKYLSAFLDTLIGPFVLVGHSYGGSVISHPLAKKSTLKALVFVAAFIQDSKETAGELNSRWPGSKLGDKAVIVRLTPTGSDLYLLPDHFAEVYAADLTEEQVATLASAQRPIDLNALGESFSEEPTWKSIPTWAVISSQDSSIPTEAQRAMAQRAGARIVEVAASHAVPLSQPSAVAETVEQAAA
jgi:pimeloyl-ACP methyl ester carboxylesterase